MSEQPTTSREVESKLRVPAKFVLPNLVGKKTGIARAKQQVTRKLHANYYDTDDFRLYRWGVTLRRREGGPDAGWHAKLPVVDGDMMGARDELHVPLDAGEPGNVPQALSSIVVPFTRGAPLVHVAELRTERIPFSLFDEQGVEFAELVDDSVSIYSDGQVIDSFREIEIEAMVEGADLAPIVDALTTLGAVPSTSSKAGAAFGPAATAPPDVPPPVEVGPRDPAADAITAFMRKYVRAFIIQDVRVRRDLPDAVHQMRVAARRLRSGLKAFGPVIDKQWASALRTELGWAAGQLGAARDTEVLLERLDKGARDLGSKDAAAVQAVIDPQLNSRLADAREDALESLNTQRHLALLDALVDGANNPRLTNLADQRCKDVFPELVDRSFRRLDRQVKRLRLEGPADDWHEARITAKRARYSAEAVSGVFGAPASRLANAISEVTEVLGEHQDACVAQDVLRELASTEGIDGQTGFALGLLHEHEFEEEIHYRLEFQRVWPGVQRCHKRTKLV